MTLDEIKIKCEHEWNIFKEKLEKIYIPEIKKNNLQIIEENNQLKNVIELLDSNLLTKEKILEESKTIIMIDNNTIDDINYLKIFSNENMLDNYAAEEIYKRIIKKINVKQLNEKINSNNQKLYKNNQIIKEINELINNQIYNLNTLKELCDALQIDEKTKRIILLYPIYSTVTKNNIKNTEKEIQEENQNEKKDNQKEINLKSKTDIEEKTEDVDPKVYETMNRYIELFNQVQKKQSDIVKKYLYLLQKYQSKYEKLTKREIKQYSRYIEILKNEHKEPEETYESDKETLAMVYYIKYMACYKEIDSEIKTSISPKEEEIHDIKKMNEYIDRVEILDLFLNDMDNICSKLQKIDKILERKEEQKDCKTFIFNDDGQTFINPKIFKEKKSLKKFYKIIEKGDEGIIQSSQGTKDIKINEFKVNDKNKYLEALNDIGIKFIKATRNNDDSMISSYIIINSNTSVIEENGILILYATPDGIDDLVTQTYKIVTNDEIRKKIKKQIELIEKNDIEELERQQEIKNLLNIQKSIKKDNQRRA